MQIRVLWFGRPSADPFKDEVETYIRRIRRRFSCQDTPQKPHRRGREDDPRQALVHEAETLARLIPDGWFVIALDEHGKQLTSVVFAHKLEEREQAGCPGIVFVVGSDLGLDDSVRRRANLTLSLSAMTLPHLIARLLLWEQIFRSVHILSGGGYHRQGVQ